MSGVGVITRKGAGFEGRMPGAGQETAGSRAQTFSEAVSDRIATGIGRFSQRRLEAQTAAQIQEAYSGYDADPISRARATEIARNYYRDLAEVADPADLAFNTYCRVVADASGVPLSEVRAGLEGLHEGFSLLADLSQTISYAGARKVMSPQFSEQFDRWIGRMLPEASQEPSGVVALPPERGGPSDKWIYALADGYYGDNAKMDLEAMLGLNLWMHEILAKGGSLATVPTLTRLKSPGGREALIIPRRAEEILLVKSGSGTGTFRGMDFISGAVGDYQRIVRLKGASVNLKNEAQVDFSRVGTLPDLTAFTSPGEILDLIKKFRSDGWAGAAKGIPSIVQEVGIEVILPVLGISYGLQAINLGDPDLKRVALRGLLLAMALPVIKQIVNTYQIHLKGVNVMYANRADAGKPSVLNLHDILESSWQPGEYPRDTLARLLADEAWRGILKVPEGQDQWLVYQQAGIKKVSRREKEAGREDPIGEGIYNARFIRALPQGLAITLALGALMYYGTMHGGVVATAQERPSPTVLDPLGVPQRVEGATLTANQVILGSVFNERAGCSTAAAFCIADPFGSDSNEYVSYSALQEGLNNGQVLIGRIRDNARAYSPDRVLRTFFDRGTGLSGNQGLNQAVEMYDDHGISEFTDWVIEGRISPYAIGVMHELFLEVGILNENNELLVDDWAVARDRLKDGLWGGSSLDTQNNRSLDVIAQIGYAWWSNDDTVSIDVRHIIERLRSVVGQLEKTPRSLASAPRRVISAEASYRQKRIPHGSVGRTGYRG